MNADVQIWVAVYHAEEGCMQWTRLFESRLQTIVLFTADNGHVEGKSVSTKSTNQALLFALIA